MYKIRGILLGAGVIGLALLSLAVQPTKTQMEPVVRVEPQQAVSLAPFTSIELDGGVKAVLQHGSPQRVTMLKGSGDLSRITVSQQQLVIEKCRDKCPRGYELHVEIVTPLITAISAANGGTIESRGNFPQQTAMSLAVSHGGTVDARTISANNITAAVAQGGRILANPQSTMVASVSNGGVITYWGNPQVTSSTEHGGVVNKGAANDLDKPLSDVEAPDSCSPTVPATPPPARAKRSRTVVI
ncbi:MAG TPA: DUF2807 domain-containing protein [Pyrinomonadaceae bacterium]|nr:DUF2807 domain-containing protein [Pyrinomonadaceae bacterium]